MKELITPIQHKYIHYWETKQTDEKVMGFLKS